MWEVEPTLYWRVKKNGKWTWVRAQCTVFREVESDEHPFHYMTYVKPPEVDESD